MLADILRLLVLNKCIYTDIDTLWQHPIDLNKQVLIYGDSYDYNCADYYNNSANCFVYYNGHISIHDDRIINLLKDNIVSHYDKKDRLSIGPKYIAKILSENKVEKYFEIVSLEEFFTLDWVAIKTLFKQDKQRYLLLCDRYIRLRSNIHLWTSTPKNIAKETPIKCLFDYERTIYPQL